MAKKTDTLQIDVILELKKGVADLKRLTEQTRSSTKKMSEGFKKVNSNLRMFKSLIGGLAVGYALKRLGSSFVDAANKTESLRLRMETLLGSTEEAAVLFQEVVKYASRVPFEYEEIAEAATILSGILRGGSKEIMRWIPLIGDVAAVAGFSFLDTTTQIQRMLSAGAATADRFREKGITALLGFTAGVQYSVDDTRRMLMDSWKDMNSKFRGATEKLALTWTGILSMIKDKWFLLRVALMDAGAFDFLKQKLTEVNKKFEKLLANKEKLKAIGEGLESILKTIESMANAFLDLPVIIREIGLIGAVLGGKKGLLLLATFLYLAPKIEETWRGLKAILKGELDWKTFLNPEAFAAWLKSLEDIEDVSMRIESGGYSMLVGAMRGFKEVRKTIYAASIELDFLNRNALIFGNTLSDMFESALTSGRNFFQSLGDALMNFLNRLVARAAAFALLQLIPGIGGWLGTFKGFVFGGGLGLNMDPKQSRVQSPNVSNSVILNVNSSVDKATKDYLRKDLVPMIKKEVFLGRLSFG